MPTYRSSNSARPAEIVKHTEPISRDDLDIFRAGSENANYFADHYFRTETSGTYWQHRDPTDPVFDSEREDTWLQIYADYKAARSPKGEFFWKAPPENRFFSQWSSGVNFVIQYDPSGAPVFWNHHGWLFQPWQLVAHHAPQMDQTHVGGVGSGKTSFIAMSPVVKAATIPYYRGFVIAPQLMQVMEAYNYILTTLEGTLYEKRFLFKAKERPWPKIIIKNSLVGTSTIEFFSIEHDYKKVLTLEGDEAYLDQAEKFDNLDDIQTALGTRLRGTVRGRPRLGKMYWEANSADNPELWYRFDMGESEPKFFLSLNPKSTDNPNLSQKDIANIRRRVGGSEEEIDQWMDGKRPMGSGEHFSRKMVENATNNELNKMMEHYASLNPSDPGYKPGYVYKRVEHVGLFHFEIPPDHRSKREYLVVSDPGSSNPPDRNSPPVGVFDVSEFPSKPMKMVAFNWVYGGGSYWPWALAHKKYVEMYKAYGQNAFDNTGVQKGFDEFVFSDMGLAAEGMNMAGSGKMLAINALKFFLARGLIEWPYIAHLNNQLTNYRLPDDKIRQDLVSMVAMAASWARRLYYTDLGEDDIDDSLNGVVIERHDRSGEERFDRSTER